MFTLLDTFFEEKKIVYNPIFYCQDIYTFEEVTTISAKFAEKVAVN